MSPCKIPLEMIVGARYAQGIAAAAELRVAMHWPAERTADDYRKLDE